MNNKTSDAKVRKDIIRLLRTANVTINDQWEGSTGYISEAEANRLANAIASIQLANDAAATPCPGCDGHECDDGCQYPGAAQPSTQNSPPVELASQNYAERIPSSDAGSAGGETVTSTGWGST